MNFSLINILIIFNALLAGCLSFRTGKAGLIAPYGVLVSLGVLLGALATGFAAPAALWPLVVVSIFYSLQEVFSAKKRTPSHFSFPVFFAFWPLLLFLTNTVFSFCLYLILGEVFKHFWIWGQFKNSRALTRIQFLDSFKIPLILAVLALSFTGLNAPALNDLGSLQNYSSLAAVSLMAVLAFSYIGLFQSHKDEERIVKLRRANPVLLDIVYKALIPGIIFIKMHQIMFRMEYTFFTHELKYLVVVSLGAVAICHYKAFSTGIKFHHFQKLYMLALFPLFLFLEDLTAFDFFCLLAILNGLFAGFELLSIKSALSLAVRKFLVYIILPTPFSPIIWFLFFKALNYSGPLKEWLVLLVMTIALSGFFLFNRQKDYFLQVIQRNDAGDPIGFVNLAVMIVFVSFLFIAKIYL